MCTVSPGLAIAALHPLQGLLPSPQSIMGRVAGGIFYNRDLEKNCAMPNRGKPRYIDLFSGCGGLSLGLELAGFERAFAVEKSPEAAATFHHNFIASVASPQEWSKDYGEVGDKRETLSWQLKNGLVMMDVAEVADLFEEPTFRDEHAEIFQKIDLVAGGPPCQGFSFAGRRRHTDKRNTLAWQFFRIVKVLRPPLVLIENVEGMTRKFRKNDEHSPIKPIIDELADIGYDVQPVLLNAKDYGVPQNRSRVFIVGKRTSNGEKGQAVHEILSRENSGESRVNSRLDIIPPELSSEISVREAIADLQFINGVCQIKPSRYVFNLNEAVREQEILIRECVGGMPKNHELRKHNRNTKARFRFIQLLEKHGIHRDVLYWWGMGEEEKFRREINREGGGLWKELAKDCYVDEHFRDYWPNSSEGVHELFAPLVNAFSSKKHSQRVLDQKRVSFTVMTIPDDYIHYCEPRVLTVREEARLQSFPDSFEFVGRVTTGGVQRKTMVPQYTQVGNAVPPLLSKAIGRCLMGLLDGLRPDSRVPANQFEGACAVRGG